MIKLQNTKHNAKYITTELQFHLLKKGMQLLTHLAMKLAITKMKAESFFIIHKEL